MNYSGLLLKEKSARFGKKKKKEWVEGACVRQKQGEGEMEKNEDMRRDIQWEDRRVSHRRI